jgi:hypothetical protein
MTCKDGKCEFQSGLHRPVRVGKAQRRYAELWVSVELPQLLKGDKP